MQAGDDVCEYCGGDTHEDEVRMCLWEGDKVFIIEDIPALVCEKCYEQFYGDTVRLSIEQLRMNGFPRQEAKRVIEVPVFSLPVIEAPEGDDDEEGEEEWDDPAKSAGMY